MEIKANNPRLIRNQTIEMGFLIQQVKDMEMTNIWTIHMKKVLAKKSFQKSCPLAV